MAQARRGLAAEDEYDPFTVGGTSGSDGFDNFTGTGIGGSSGSAARAEPESAEQAAKRRKAEPQLHAGKGGGRSVAELIGVVRPVKNPLDRRLCAHFLAGDCLWGDQCRFSHDSEELRAGAPATESLNFSNLDSGHVFRSLAVPREHLRFFMTEATRRRLTEATGVSDVSWEPRAAKVVLSGMPLQVDSAERLLRQAVDQCRWGVSEAKVEHLLTPRACKGARMRLSPMTPELKQAAANFSAANLQFKIGSDPSNSLVLRGKLISRHHVTMEFAPDRGLLYVLDTSTNGTFLNGMRLPSRGGKEVVLFHGDELRFPEPGEGQSAQEFGYMVNLETS